MGNKDGKKLTARLQKEIAILKKNKVYKKGNILGSQQATMVVMDGEKVVMLSSNNYLGLASDPRVKESAQAGF